MLPSLAVNSLCVHSHLGTVLGSVHTTVPTLWISAACVSLPPTRHPPARGTYFRIANGYTRIISLTCGITVYAQYPNSIRGTIPVLQVGTDTIAIVSISRIISMIQYGLVILFRSYFLGAATVSGSEMSAYEHYLRAPFGKIPAPGVT